MTITEKEINEEIPGDMSILIVNARKVMCKAFNEIEGFRQVYIDNIAMLLHDRYDIINYEQRNKAAEDIMNLIFCDGGRQ